MYSQQELVAGLNGKIYRMVKCHGCGKQGHYVSQCPENQEEAQQHLNLQEEDEDEAEEEQVEGGAFLQLAEVDEQDSSSSDSSGLIDFCFVQVVSKAKDVNPTGKKKAKGNKQDKSSLLIDTGSSFSCINNPKLLVNIREAEVPITGVSNGGTMVNNMEADLPGFFKVYYNEKLLLNILSFKDVRKRFRITVDTAVENVICVHISEEKVLKFVEVSNGVYMWNADNNANNKQVSVYSFLTLVEANKKNFTRRELNAANDAKKLYVHLGMPDYKKFFKMLEDNKIRDCPLTIDDAKRCLHIYGPEIAKMKGSKARLKPGKIKEYKTFQMPRSIIDNHGSDQLSMDYLYIQGMPFHHSITKSYKMRTIESLRGKAKPNSNDIERMSKRAINIYHKRGVKVSQVNVDNEFEPLRDKIDTVNLNIVGAGEHVGDVERSIRSVKDKTRSNVHGLPYRRYPTEMVCGVVIKSIKDLNNEIPNDGVSENVPPGPIISGIQSPSYTDIMKLNFGDYVQTHVPRTITNTNENRTVGAIALYPSSSEQGGWYFMSLDTGRRLHCYQWDQLPIPREVIARVEAIAIEQGHPLISQNFKYQWSPDGDEIMGEGENDDGDDNIPDLIMELPPPPVMLAIERGAETTNEEMELIENDNTDNILIN